jgi:vitamin B12/bleomycin/antimicrobial peptide transport system ATP-binding/permease protein
LTESYFHNWLADRTYYHMQLFRRATDNSPSVSRKICGMFVEQTLSLTLALLNATVTLIAFVSILWALSGTLGFALRGSSYSVRGYMVWVAWATPPSVPGSPTASAGR